MSSSYTKNGETFSVGDYVLINYDDEIEGNVQPSVGDGEMKRNVQPAVGSILYFRVVKKEVMAHVMWFYRPHEVFGKHPAFMAQNELVMSTHCDCVSIDTFIGRCSVHTFKEFRKLKKVTDVDYYWRISYIPPRWIKDDLVPLYCTCKLPENPDKPMMQCDTCKEWFHPECEGMTSDEAKKREPYSCKKCSSADLKKRQR